MDKYIRENVLFRMDKYITMKYFGQIHEVHILYMDKYIAMKMNQLNHSSAAYKCTDLSNR